MVSVFRVATLPSLQDRYVAHAGVSVERAGYAVLRVLAEEGPLRMTELSQRLGVDGSTTSRQVKQLVIDGLLARTDDPVDGRARLLSLTAAGDEAVGQLRRVRHELFAAVLADWPDAEPSVLAPLLHRLAEDLRTKVGLF
jgi:DNA-binding MarR family transcriptional regulator